VHAERRRGVAPRVQEPAERVRGGSAKEEVVLRWPERPQKRRIDAAVQLTLAASGGGIDGRRGARARASGFGAKEVRRRGVEPFYRRDRTRAAVEFDSGSSPTRTRARVAVQPCGGAGTGERARGAERGWREVQLQRAKSGRGGACGPQCRGRDGERREERRKKALTGGSRGSERKGGEGRGWAGLSTGLKGEGEGAHGWAGLAGPADALREERAGWLGCRPLSFFFFSIFQNFGQKQTSKIQINLNFNP